MGERKLKKYMSQFKIFDARKPSMVWVKLYDAEGGWENFQSMMHNQMKKHMEFSSEHEYGKLVAFPVPQGS